MAISASTGAAWREQGTIAARDHRRGGVGQPPEIGSFRTGSPVVRPCGKESRGDIAQRQAVGGKVVDAQHRRLTMSIAIGNVPQRRANAEPPAQHRRRPQAIRRMGVGMEIEAEWLARPGREPFGQPERQFGAAMSANQQMRSAWRLQRQRRTPAVRREAKAGKCPRPRQGTDQRNCRDAQIGHPAERRSRRGRCVRMRGERITPRASCRRRVDGDRA